MDELVEKIEALDGPDREVDEAIADLLFTGKQRACIAGLSDEEGGMWMWEQNGHIQNALRYTASLDAAMSLVPEGVPWKIEDHPEWSVSAVVNDTQFFASTPALSLCAAALKARKADD